MMRGAGKERGKWKGVRRMKYCLIANDVILLKLFSDYAKVVVIMVTSFGILE